MTTAEMKSKLLEIALKKGKAKLPVPGPKPAQVAASASRKPRGVSVTTKASTVDPTTQLGMLGPAPGFNGKGEPIADPKKDGIPVGLQTQNRTKPTAEQQARIDAAAEKAKADRGSEQHQQELRAMQKANKREKQKIKSTARKERRAAEAAGATKAWPKTGRDADAALAKRPGKARDGKKPVPAAKPAKVAKRPASGPGNGKNKTAIVGELLTRKGGCTNADILSATEWPTVSVPAMAKACGLVLRKEKNPGEPTRYFGVAK